MNNLADLRKIVQTYSPNVYVSYYSQRALNKKNLVLLCVSKYFIIYETINYPSFVY